MWRVRSSTRAAVRSPPARGCWCSRGRDNLCPSYDVLGFASDGGYAELVSVPVENLVPIPAHIDFVQAAAFPLTFLTAWHMLLNAARLRAGEVVLVLAGGSGVGQAAIQVARQHGARVFATAGPAKIERTRELGAEQVFDHYATDFSRDLRSATAGRGADIVVEHVGEATWDRSVRALARGGRLVTCGATSGPRASLDLRHLFASCSPQRSCSLPAVSGRSSIRCCRCRPPRTRSAVSSAASSSAKSCSSPEGSGLTPWRRRTEAERRWDTPSPGTGLVHSPSKPRNPRRRTIPKSGTPVVSDSGRLG